jgi:hypothetical protein
MQGFECMECGSVVSNTVLHDEFHLRLLQLFSSPSAAAVRRGPPAHWHSRDEMGDPRISLMGTTRSPAPATAASASAGSPRANA